MNKETSVPNKAAYGGMYGAVAGLAFAIGSAGLHAYYLANAHVILSWAAFLIMAVAGLLLGWLVGSTSTRIGRTFAALLFWVPTGILLAILANIAPLWLVPTLVKAQLPQYTDVLEFGWQESYWILLGFSVVISLVGFSILALLQAPMVDGAYFSISKGAILPALVAAIFLAGGVGGVIDTLINQPIRGSVVALEQVLRYQIEHANEVVPKETARSLRLSSLRAVKDGLDNNWKLAIASVDLAYSETHLVLITGNNQAMCYVFGTQVSNCMPMEIQP